MREEQRWGGFCTTGNEASWGENFPGHPFIALRRPFVSEEIKLGSCGGRERPGESVHSVSLGCCRRKLQQNMDHAKWPRLASKTGEQAASSQPFIPWGDPPWGPHPPLLSIYP